MEEFDTYRAKHLYKLWNRIALGSYLALLVKEVEISKDDGSIRKLEISTISNDVGQMVIKMYLESRLEKEFSPNSYGYCSDKKAHQAIETVGKNCWKMD